MVRALVFFVNCSIIGMTNHTEARLAREAEISYSTIAMSTDYDCWHEDHDKVSVNQIIKTLNDNSEKAVKLICHFVKEKQFECSKKIKDLSKNSVITDITKVKKTTRNRLKHILII